MFRRVAPGGRVAHGISLFAILGVLGIAGCKGQQARPVAPMVAATHPPAAATSPVTREAIVFTHVVNADTAMVLRGISDADVTFDAIPAGTRVRAIGVSNAYLRVVTADGRDGLVARERLEEISPATQPSATQKAADAGEKGRQFPPHARGNEFVTSSPGQVEKVDCPSAAEIQSAIDRAQKYLFARQVNGNWDQPAPADGPPPMSLTALVLNALAISGGNFARNEKSPASTLVNGQAPRDTFSAAMRAQYWYMEGVNRNKEPMGRDDLIKVANRPDRPRHAFFGPMLDDREFDWNSTYYGIMGLKNLEKAGLEVPLSLWAAADESIRGRQMPDGHFKPFPGGQKLTSQFIADAAAYLSLQIAADFFDSTNDATRTGHGSDLSLEAAIRQLNEELKARNLGAASCETACWIERIGDSSGRKYLGGRDWFSDRARALVNSQRPDGSWNGDVRDTAFGLIFFCRGNAPIAMNKLAYGPDAGKSAWNQRPDDVSHLVEWLGRGALCGVSLNRQVVSIDSPIDDFLDAPILYICGDREIQFRDAQLDKLRDYVNRGGMIVGNADNASGMFSKSFETLGGKLFPRYEFRHVPPSHPIFDEMYHAVKWRAAPEVRGMSNGVRELVILLPRDDASLAWQTRTTGSRRERYELGANLFFYATGRGTLSTKADRRHKTARRAVADDPIIRVAKLNAGDNWEPEPAAWSRMIDVAADELHVILDVQRIKPGDGMLKHFAMAHLTGTTSFTLTQAARDEIRTFVDNGGTLLIDAAGGSVDFADAADAELKAIFGNDAAQLTVPVESAVLFTPKDGLKPIDGVRYRSAARRLDGLDHETRLRAMRKNGRFAVFFSHEDLTAGMAGVRADGIIGYDVPTATAIVSDILRYAASK